jgi:DNA-binding SARP family transcriptional activator/RecA/RadA recombinase
MPYRHNGRIFVVINLWGGFGMLESTDLNQDVRFGVLGTVTAWRGPHQVRFGAGKHRLLLAALVLHNNSVDRDEIIEFVWQSAAPKSAVNLVQKYVGDLRRALYPAGHGLVSAGSRYRLRLSPDQLDSRRFTDLVHHAQTDLSAGRLDVAYQQLTEAVALWRGPAYSDIDVPAVVTERARLEEYRAGALEMLAEITLARGDHAAAVAELAGLTAEHPFRERLRELHMLALYRSGRQAEALAVFRDTQRLLADELGADPGPALQRLHDQVLNSNVEPLQPAPAQPEQRIAFPVCQLPPDIPDFTGRTDVLAHLVQALTIPGGTPTAPVQVVVGGPGIGKSTLAVHAAYTVRERFPDGQLYLDLAGTSAAPRDPAAMVAELLRALGVTGAAVPEGLHERTALYRSLLTGRTMLLVLDDAASAGQLRPLLPATGSCAVLVTSRQRLPDLPGARHVPMDVFSPEEAHELLARIVGQDRTAEAPTDVAAILKSCDHLPLAIRIAGAKLAGRQAWSLGVLRDRLADESRRLNELRVGELGVRASFDLSRRLLPPDASAAFRLLGLLGPHAVAGWVIGPLLGRQHADDALDALVDANLVRLVDTDGVGQPRYELHDLLRTFAAEAAEEDPADLRRDAVARLLSAWVDLTEQATAGLYPSLFRVKARESPRLPLPPDLTDQLLADPVAWFDTEHRVLLGAVQLAVDWRLDELAWALAVAIVPYYDHRNLYVEWQRSHEIALDAVRGAGNLHGEAALLRGIGQIHLYRDDYTAAADVLKKSVSLYQTTGDKRGEALAVAGLGTIARIEGRYDQAVTHASAALDTFVAEGDRTLEAQLRSAIGTMRLAQGRHEEAGQWLHDALRIARDSGDRHREANVLRGLSRLHGERGAHGNALACLQLALEMFNGLDDERCAAYALMDIGVLHARDDKRWLAAPALTHAAAVFQRTGGEHVGRAKCLQLLGELDLAHDDADAARRHLTEARQLWRQLADDDRVAATTHLLDRT